LKWRVWQFWLDCAAIIVTTLNCQYLTSWWPGYTIMWQGPLITQLRIHMLHVVSSLLFVTFIQGVRLYRVNSQKFVSMKEILRCSVIIYTGCCIVQGELTKFISMKEIWWCSFIIYTGCCIVQGELTKFISMKEIWWCSFIIYTGCCIVQGELIKFISMKEILWCSIIIYTGCCIEQGELTKFISMKKICGFQLLFIQGVALYRVNSLNLLVWKVLLCSVIIPLKARINLNYVEILSWYRAVNTSTRLFLCTYRAFWLIYVITETNAHTITNLLAPEFLYLNFSTPCM
jgi:hypothetical protein